jgi:hypothetical protein
VDELDAQAGGSDPFRPAERNEDDLFDSPEDGSTSRRAARIERLGLIASKSAMALVLLGAGALTARIVSYTPPPSAEVVMPSAPSSTQSLEDQDETSYPPIGEVLGSEEESKRDTKRHQRADMKRSRIRFSSGSGSRGAARSGQVSLPQPPQPNGSASSGQSDKRDVPSTQPKDRDHGSQEDKKPKPEPAPEPDRNLFHVWKQGTTDHVYYWEEWKTVDYYAPQEYYLYRDGNGSEGSFFSEQVAGTIPLTTDDGPLGYVYASGGEGRTPLYYLRGPNNHRRRDLYTSDAATRATFDNAGWTDFGVAGYLGAPFQE